MNKIICDICKLNEADRNFKVKKRKCFSLFEYRMALPYWRWVDIDICEECYNKLIKAKEK